MCYRTRCEQVIKSDDFRADKAPFKIGVYLPRRLGGFRPLFDRPGADFRLPRSKERYKPEQLVALPYQAVQTRFVQSKVLKKHIPVLALKRHYLFLKLCAYRQRFGALIPGMLKYCPVVAVGCTVPEAFSSRFAA